MYRRVCISSTNLVACLNKLRLNKGKVANNTDEHGKPTQAEAFLERGNVPFVVDINGLTWLFFIMDETSELTIPKNDAPVCKLEWDSEDLINVGTEEEPIMVTKPRPEYEKQLYDENDNPVGSMMQMVGWI